MLKPPPPRTTIVGTAAGGGRLGMRGMMPRRPHRAKSGRYLPERRTFGRGERVSRGGAVTILEPPPPFPGCEAVSINASGSVAGNIGASETNVFDCGTSGDMVDSNGVNNLFGTSDSDCSPAVCSHFVDASLDADRSRRLRRA